MKNWAEKKLLYLVKTLSRTKRKDYENYVINSIYRGVVAGLSDRSETKDLKPVSQAFIRKSQREHYFIDLYFPQLNIGIECDEGHHFQKDGTRACADDERELNIFDLLNEVGAEGYEAIHIKVAGEGFASVEEQILAAVDKIKRAWGGLSEEEKTWLPAPSPAEYFRGKNEISVRDNVVFGSIAEACNVVLKSGYEGMQKSWFYPLVNGERREDFCAWFPKLAVKIGDEMKAASRFENLLSADGMTIRETCVSGRNKQRKDNKGELPRVTFARVQDPVTGEVGYRFIGVFQKSGREGRTAIYTRISDRFEIV